MGNKDMEENQVKKIVDAVCDKSEMIRMVEKHFGEPEEMIQEFKEDLVKAIIKKLNNGK